MRLFEHLQHKIQKTPEQPHDTIDLAERELSILELCGVLAEGFGEPAKDAPNTERISLDVLLEAEEDRPAYKITDTSPNSAYRKFRIEEIGSEVMYTLDFIQKPSSNPADKPIFLASPQLKHARLMGSAEEVRTFTSNVAELLQVAEQ